jgi:hypothetical protein
MLKTNSNKSTLYSDLEELNSQEDTPPVDQCRVPNHATGLKMTAQNSQCR